MFGLNTDDAKGQVGELVERLKGNANLNDELERRLKQVSTLRELGQEIGQELDVERVFQLVVERAA